MTSLLRCMCFWLTGCYLIGLSGCYNNESAPPRMILTADQASERDRLLGISTRLSEAYLTGQALAYLDSTLAIDSTDYRAHFLKGRLYRRAGDFALSSAAYEQAVLYNPELYDGWYNLANNALWRDQFQDAVSLYDRLLEKKERPSYWHNKGRAHLSLGQTEKAKASFERSIILDSTYAFGHASLGFLAEQLGAFDSMLVHYQKAVHYAPGSDEYWYKKGLALSRLGRLEDGIDAYDKALSINANHHGALFNKGRNAVELGLPGVDELLKKANVLRQEDAEFQRLQRNVMRFPEDGYHHYALGNEYVERKQWEAARQQFELALLVADNDVKSLINLGNVFVMQEKLGQAVETYLRALHIDSSSVDLLRNLAIVSMQQGENKKAEAFWQQLLRHDPDNPIALKGLNRLEKEGIYP